MTENLDEIGYEKQRSFQQLSNLGEGESSANHTTFEQTSIEERNGQFSRVGRNPEQGVAVTKETFSTMDVSGPMFLTPEQATKKAEDTGVQNMRTEDGYYIADHPEFGPAIMGRIIEHVLVPNSTFDKGSVLDDIETFINAPFSGLARGVLKAGGNTLGALGVLDQDKVNEFFSKIDELNDIAVEDNLPAKIGGIAGEITGQFILPIVQAYKGLIAIGASPLLASILSEAGSGFAVMSPGEENLFNMISENENVATPIRELMAIDPDDPDYVNRSRNAVEALAILGLAETATRQIIKKIEQAKQLEKTPEAQEIQAIADDPQLREALDNPELDPVAQDADSFVPVAPFFSAVEQAVKGLKQEVGQGKQMRAMIAKTAGVKQEEMAWIGLDDFLKEKKKVTKQEILKYVQDNIVDIKEVTLQYSKLKRNLTKKEMDKAISEFSNMSWVIRRISFLEKSGFKVQFDPEAGEVKVVFDENNPVSIISSASPTELANNLQAEFIHHINKRELDPKFSEYTLPGGQNYREVLLTLPERPVAGNTAEALQGNFLDSHFNRPNILAHIRLNDHVGTKGEKILFIEEIQSDWMQTGRTQGFKGEVEKITELPKGYTVREIQTPGEARNVWIVEDPQGIIFSNGDLNTLKEDAISQVLPRLNEEANQRAISNAPLKKTWHEMAFRRAAQMAAEQGYDIVAWTTGKIQNDRFPNSNLSPFYDKVLKNYASKFGKKFDSKVGTLHINTLSKEGSYTVIETENFDGYTVVDDINNMDITPRLTLQEAEAELEKLELGTFGKEIWSLPITDRMRKTLTHDGVPLFSVGAVPLLAIQEDPEEIQVANAPSRFLRAILGNAPEKTADTARAITNYTQFKDKVPTGVDFNMKNINTTADVKNQIDIVSQSYAGVVGTPIPQSVTQDIANLLGDSPEAASAAVRELPSDVKDLHVRALTMRNMLVASAEETDRMARLVSQGGADVTDGDYLRFREQIVRHSQLQKSMKGVQSEIGRALASFRIPAEAGNRNPQIVEELVNRLGGRGTAHEIADRWLTTPIDRRADFADRSMWAKSRAAVFEMWINGLLSGLRTHQVNTGGNAIFSVFQIPERVGAAIIGTALRNSDRVRFRETMAMARGASEGFMDGLKLAVKTWKTEMPSDGIAKIEAQTMRAITPENFNVNPDSLGGKAIDYLGQFLRLPGRGLLAEDEFFKAVGYRSELYSMTTRSILKARDENTVAELIIDVSNYAQDKNFDDLTRLRETADKRNLNAEELTELNNIMIENPSSEIDMASHDYATMVTFQTELGEAGKAVQRAVGSIPGARIIAPFIRTPTNIVKEFARRGPLAALMPSVHKMLKAGGAKRDLAIARIGIGTSLMTWAHFLHQDGNITGGGPGRSEGTYSQWRATNEPYSVKINGTWYPYGRIEPLAMLFGSVADAGDFIAYSNQEEQAQEVYLSAFVGVMKNISDKTTLQGITNFSDAYSDPGRYAERYIANLARTAMPFSSMMRDITRAVDPLIRETRGEPDEGNPINELLSRVINTMKTGIPGMSDDLPAKRTFWAEERRSYQGPGVNSFFAFRTHKVKKSPIDEEMVKLNTPLSMPSPRVGNYTLSSKQYDRLVVLMNKTAASMPDVKLLGKQGPLTMRTSMNNLVQSQLWKSLTSDDVKVQYLRSIRNDFVEAAKRVLATEDNEVGAAKVQEDVDKMMVQGQQGILQQLGPLSSQIKPPTGVH